MEGSMFAFQTATTKNRTRTPIAVTTPTAEP